VGGGCRACWWITYAFNYGYGCDKLSSQVPGVGSLMPGLVSQTVGNATAEPAVDATDVTVSPELADALSSLHAHVVLLRRYLGPGVYHVFKNAALLLWWQLNLIILWVRALVCSDPALSRACWTRLAASIDRQMFKKVVFFSHPSHFVTKWMKLMRILSRCSWWLRNPSVEQACSNLEWICKPCSLCSDPTLLPRKITFGCSETPCVS